MEFVRYNHCPVIEESNVKIFNQDRENCLLAIIQKRFMIAFLNFASFNYNNNKDITFIIFYIETFVNRKPLNIDIMSSLNSCIILIELIMINLVVRGHKARVL